MDEHGDVRPVEPDEVGVDDLQINAWANTYAAEHGSGDVATFVGWIAEQERHRRG